jgi:outer membrane autotransporter protein
VNQTGFDFNIAGLNAGADYRVQDDLLVGLATGYSHTAAIFHGSSGRRRGAPGILTPMIPPYDLSPIRFSTEDR